MAVEIHIVVFSVVTLYSLVGG